MTHTRSRRFARFALAVAAVAPLVAGPAVALAADPPAGPPPAGQPPAGQPPAGHRNWLQQRLGLSDDQAQQIRTIFQQQAQTGRPIHQQMRQLRADLRQLALNGGDDAAIKAKTDEIERLVAQDLALRVDTLKKVSPILTPEQRDKFAKLGTAPHGRWHRQPRQS